MFDPLSISRQMLTTLGIKTSLYREDRIPHEGSVLVVSNHRSILDAPLLMAALDRPIRFACHRYMGQVPLMRDLVKRFGCLPMDLPEQRQQTFFQQATQALRAQEVVGIFPEGATPMIHETQPNSMGEFQRGFAHLALRAPVEDVTVLPVAIASHHEINTSLFPIRLLHLFDPSEPLFDQSGWHPFVMYQQVTLLIGRPIQITPAQQQDYHGKRARAQVMELTDRCHHEIKSLLKYGAY